MKERKKLKIRIVPRKGIHSFDQKLPIYPCDPSTYKVKEEIANEYESQHHFALANNINGKDKYRIFFLSEYLKRQFFLDFTREKKDGRFVKEKNGRYKTIDYGTNEAKEIIFRNFNLASNEKLQFEKDLNDRILVNILSKSGDLYSFIKNFYDDRYRRFRKIISDILEKAELNQDSENEVIDYKKIWNFRHIFLKG